MNGYGPSGTGLGTPSIAGAYGRSDPSGMTRLLVKGTYPPAPSGTAAGGANQQKKRKHAEIIWPSCRRSRIATLFAQWFPGRVLIR